MILIQPDERKRQKTDRRDAAALSELLWVNRQRLLAGKPVRGLRQVDISSTTDQENRQLTTLRKDAGRARTRLINMIKHIPNYWGSLLDVATVVRTTIAREVSPKLAAAWPDGY